MASAFFMQNDGVFKALADPTRRRILRLLRERNMSAGELAAQFPLAKSTLSGHFSVLKGAGLIQADRYGSTLVYSLNVSVLEDALTTVMDMLSVGGSATKKDQEEEHATDLED
jgi:DNA-binding transcriptional ArsR family regulator